MALGRKEYFYLFFAVVTLFVFQFWGIGNKSIHHDESINGWFLDQIGQNRFFQYDPSNYHGPFFFYYAKLVETIFGRSFISLRIATVFMSVLTWSMVIAWGLYRNNGMKVVGLLAGLSPAVIFFGRSGIHESTFVFFQILTFLSFIEWRVYRNQKGLTVLIYAICGAAFNKETFVVSVGVAGLAIIIALFSKNQNFFGPMKKALHELKSVDWWLHAPILLFLFWALYTGAGKHQRGVLDFFISFVPWLKTGSHGAGHEKVWYYWLKLLSRYEFLVVVGVVLAVIQIFLKNVLLRGVSLFALGVLAIYSAIPYKTVWCILTIMWPFYFVVGLRQWSKEAFTGIMAVSLVGVAFGIYSSWSAIYSLPISYEHPYVYVQTRPEMTDFTNFIREKSKLSKKAIITAAEDAWPLPYVFGDLANYTYQNAVDQVLALESKDIALLMVDEPMLNVAIQERYKDWPKRSFSIRDGRAKFISYFNPEVFTAQELAKEYLNNVD